MAFNVGHNYQHLQVSEIEEPQLPQLLEEGGATSCSSSAEAPTSASSAGPARFGLKAAGAGLAVVACVAAVAGYFNSVSPQRPVAVSSSVVDLSWDKADCEDQPQCDATPVLPDAEKCLADEWEKLAEFIIRECPGKTYKNTVTGLMFDINRGKWGAFSRGYNKYLGRFRTVIKGWSQQDDLGKIFFLDKEANDVLKDELEKMSEERAASFCALEMTLDELPFRKCLHDKIDDAFAQMKKCAPHTLSAVVAMRTEPEFTHSNYLEIIMTRIWQYFEVAKMNPFKSEVIGILDLGAHIVNFLDEVEKNGPIEFPTCGTDEDPKVCAAVVRCKHLQEKAETYAKDLWSISLDGNGVLSGGTISGTPEAIVRAGVPYKDSVLRHLCNGFIQDDQPYWLLTGLTSNTVEFIDAGDNGEDWTMAELAISWPKKYNRPECKVTHTLTWTQ